MKPFKTYSYHRATSAYLTEVPVPRRVEYNSYFSRSQAFSDSVYEGKLLDELDDEQELNFEEEEA